ncbi:MAG: hypothetical protein COA45_04340 [Zetaproteobacteria bacterium]|nr:MAG: hypothetical protein COA45_04340 [Zetaproteobacteria bacterium]
MARQKLFPLIFMIAISFVPILSIHLPRALSFLPIMIGLVMSLWWILIKKEHLKHCTPYILCIFCIAGLCIISTLWSVSPIESYSKALKSSAILLFSIPLFNLARTIQISALKPFLWLFPAGVTLSALLCSFDLAFNLPIYQVIHHVGEDYRINTAVMNRGVICTTLSYFAAFLFIHHMENPKRIKYGLITVMTASVLTMLALTQSQSGQTSFLIGGLTLLFFPHKMKASYTILTLSIILAMFLTPYMVTMLYDALIDNAQTIPWLKNAYAGNRLEIWEFVMRYALDSPLYGYGMEATRYITDFHHKHIYHPDTSVLHPHNFSIQVWIEFGLIGIIAASGFFIFTIRAIQISDLCERKTIMAVFIATLSVASIGYGLWQSWWLGEFIFLAAISATMSRKTE